MNQQTLVNTTDSGLSRFFAKIYGMVGFGIGLSAMVAFLMLVVFPQNTVNILVNAPMIYFGAVIVELILVVLASRSAMRNTPMALPLFLIYSALNGFTLSFILLRYTGGQVLTAFVSSAAVFFAMSAVGFVTKKDLSGMAKAAMMVLFGIIIASIVNLFLGSGLMDYLISIVTVLVFSGLVAYDNQLIKHVYYQNNGRPSDGWVISMALNLYLDFINIFISILNIINSND